MIAIEDGDLLLLETGDYLLLENDEYMGLSPYRKPLADGITTLWTNEGAGQQLFYSEPSVRRYIRE